MRSFVLRIDEIVLPSILFPNAARRAHYHARAAISRSLREAAKFAAIREALCWTRVDEPLVTGPVRVRVLVSWPAGRRMPDLDALPHALKPVMDGLTDARIWADDRQIVEACYRQERDPAGRGFIEIEVIALDQQEESPCASM